MTSRLTSNQNITAEHRVVLFYIPGVPGLSTCQISQVRRLFNTRAHQTYHRYILQYLVLGTVNDLEHENLRMFSSDVVRLGL